MDILFILDFDGVLFNSAYEAFTVSKKVVADDPRYRDVDYEEFLAYRSVVTDAWQYRRLFARDCYVPRDALRLVTPEQDDWDFARDFFSARADLMADPEWPKVMPPYDFFLRLKPLLLAHHDCFAILSTRNVQSIRQTLAFHDADVVPVFGQEDIRRAGSKLNVARENGWLDNGKHLTVYLDDMNSHLEPFEGAVHLPLHADWGYDRSTPGSLTDHQVMTIFRSLLALSKSRTIKEPG